MHGYRTSSSSIKPLRGRRAPRACINRRSQRRNDFARTQRLFKHNRSRCAKNIISGEWSSTATSVPLSDQERYWKGVFEEPSVRDQRRAQPVCEANWNLVQPVTSAELSDNFKMLNDSAPGHDGMRLKDLRGIPSEQLLARFNLWLWTGYQPKRCRVGETVCIPKVRGSMEASNHRPITMSIMIIRLFHKIMSARMESLLPVSKRQKAFRTGDRIADNILLLRHVIKHHQANNRSLNIVFVDVRKAFDSVSHDSILIAAQRLGVPPF